MRPQTPEFFNANDGDTDEFDDRSDDKGAEPESVTVGTINGKPYGFVGLERAGGGVLVYDLSNPTEPVFNQYIRTEGDIAPEGLQFIAAEDSSNGTAMLAVANEVSKTTTLYQISENVISGDDSDNTITGTDGNDFIDAGAGNNTIDAGAGNDIIIGGQGDNRIDGGDGIDTVIYAGNKADFNIKRDGDQIRVGSNTDTLTNVEVLRFNDGNLNTADINTPFDTAEVAQLKGLNNYEVDPVVTIGETINGYTAPGILDGLGAYKLDDNTVRVLANHELRADAGYAYTLENGTELTGARVSYFDIDKDSREVVGAGLAYDTIINRQGEVVDEASDLESEGLNRLCSAQYIGEHQFGAGRGLEDGMFFTGEETSGGTEYVVDVAN